MGLWARGKDTLVLHPGQGCARVPLRLFPMPGNLNVDLNDEKLHEGGQRELGGGFAVVLSRILPSVYQYRKRSSGGLLIFLLDLLT